MKFAMRAAAKSFRSCKPCGARMVPFAWHGEFYDFELPVASRTHLSKVVAPCSTFGGISPLAQQLCAKHCDVFLMWPETEEQLLSTMRSMAEQAEQHERRIDFGLRIHMIVRESEAEASHAAERLISKLDRSAGEAIKHRSQDSRSAGVLRQDELRAKAGSDLYIEPHIWSGIGLARSGCGSAIVGDPDQVLAKLNRLHRHGYSRVHTQWLSAHRGVRAVRALRFAKVANMPIQ